MKFSKFLICMLVFLGGVLTGAGLTHNASWIQHDDQTKRGKNTKAIETVLDSIDTRLKALETRE